jgi:hypothetical protein
MQCKNGGKNEGRGIPEKTFQFTSQVALHNPIAKKQEAGHTHGKPGSRQTSSHQANAQQINVSMKNPPWVWHFRCRDLVKL